MRDRISPAAEVLHSLLMYTPSEGPCPVTSQEAQAMWDAAADLHGFAAVTAFLDVCKSIHSKERADET